MATTYSGMIMKPAPSLLTALAYCGCSMMVRSQDWNWATSFGGGNYEFGSSIAVDGNGDSHVAGSFESDSITLGASTLINAGIPNPYVNARDVLVVKCDASGDVVWARAAGTPNTDAANAIAVDDQGSSYVTGYFGCSTITFGPFTLDAEGTSRHFLVKYDTEGNVVWATGADNGCNEAWAVAVDDARNSYVAGDFNCGPIIFGSDTLPNAGAPGYADVLLLKYDAQGHVLWARSAGGQDGDYAFGVAVDDNGNCYVTGSFSSPTITFGPTTLTCNGGGMFIAKYDPSGNLLWVRGSEGGGFASACAVAVDEMGSAYVTGSVFGSVTIGSVDLAGASAGDIYVAKFDASGVVRRTGFDRANHWV